MHHIAHILEPSRSAHPARLGIDRWVSGPGAVSPLSDGESSDDARDAVEFCSAELLGDLLDAGILDPAQHCDLFGRVDLHEFVQHAALCQIFRASS